MQYTELQVTTNFTFLRGGSHPEEIIERALQLGHTQIAITDRNTLAGIVRAHSAASGKDIRLIPACRLDLMDGPSLLAYPTNKEAYARLSGLLTKGNLRTEKGQCTLYKEDVYTSAKGIQFIVVPPDTLNDAFEFEDDFKAALHEYKRSLGPYLYLGATRSYQANDSKKLFRLSQLSQQLSIPLVATNDVHYHTPARRELQDVLTCVREKCTIYNAGYRLYQNAERYLKPHSEMARLFQQYPDAIARTQEIAARCQFSLSELQYVYPEELTTEGRTPLEELTCLTWEGARKKYGAAVPEKIITAIRHELHFIEKKNYASYFLTVYDIVRFANEHKILCQGRGSAANSTVCYVLGITSVDPTKFDLLFERFISDARDEPPDIDVDFEHERREEVIQYVYEKYGRHRAAIIATVTQLHTKGALRDVAKAMGMSADAVGRLSSSIWEFTDEWFDNKRISSEGFDAGDPHLRKILALTEEYKGFPRQLGQHTGGFVITQGTLSDLCPVLNARMENRTCIEWNKDDIDALGFMKIDVLALGMLTCIRKGFDLLARHYGKQYTLATIPQDEPAVYNMICAADTLGVFQIESRAQMSMLPRLQPREFYDLVVEVAIVRPGPIQGDMVHPYLKRRNGEEAVDYPSKELREILEKTLGVPLFQEQAMKIAIVAAGFTPAEADELRRSMATFKAHGQVTRFEKKLIDGMVGKGYPEDFARRVFRQLEGFGSYGFPESHAASFALLVYVSAWIKCHYPDVFATALLNSMPMGFYQPAQIIIDAKKHHVEVRQIDVNHSYWDNTLETTDGPFYAIRLGFRQAKGLNEEDMQLLVAARAQPFTSVHFLKDAGVPQAALERLADADAFRSMNLDRRQALWQIAALYDSPTGMFKGQQQADVKEEQHIRLPHMMLSEHVTHDYASMALSLKAHPVSFARQQLTHMGVTPLGELASKKNGDHVKVAGLVLVRQRPGTAKGVLFITIEDETGFANLVVFQHISTDDQYRGAILQSRLFMAEGKVQQEGIVIHIVVQRCYNLSGLLRNLTDAGQAAAPPNSLPQEQEAVRKVIQPELFPDARNFK